MMFKVGVGDRVRVVKPLLNVKAALGKEATIETVCEGLLYLCFDEPVPHDYGHDSDGHYHWYAHSDDMIERVSQPKVGEFVVWMGEFHRVVQVDTITRISVEDGKGQLFAIEAADVEPIRDAA